MKDLIDNRTDFRSDQNLDRILRAFFRAEMPLRWPEWKSPQQSVIVPARGHFGSTTLRSRFALAASIALMIFGFLFVSDKLQNGDLPTKNGMNTGFDDPQIKKERIKVNGEGQSEYQFDVEGGGK
ncbi:MAG: hypothetical protein ACJ8FY_00935 [Gemmataceae bacterium]